MTTVGLGEQGSQAVGSGIKCLPCQKFLRFFPIILVKHWGVPLRKFSAPWDREFSTESLDTPPHPLIQTFSIPEIIERLEGSPTAFFGSVRQKISEESLDTSPSLLSINFFATRNFLKHMIEEFLYEMFRYCETKNFRQKIVILPFSSPSSLLSINFFDTRNFVKDTRVALGSFSVLWDKTILTENRDTRPLSYP